MLSEALSVSSSLTGLVGGVERNKNPGRFADSAFDFHDRSFNLTLIIFEFESKS